MSHQTKARELRLMRNNPIIRVAVPQRPKRRRAPERQNKIEPYLRGVTRDLRALANLLENAPHTTSILNQSEEIQMRWIKQQVFHLLPNELLMHDGY